MDDLLDARQAAEYLDCCARSLRLWVASGRLPPPRRQQLSTGGEPARFWTRAELGPLVAERAARRAGRSPKTLANKRYLARRKS